MAEPTIKSRLESKFFLTQKADVKSRLDQCLALDFKHFTPGEHEASSLEGRSVFALQVALATIKMNILPSLPDITDSRGEYGATTRAAVLHYKSDQSHVIIRRGQRLDDVIGRMTITQIDNDLLAIEGKIQPPLPPPTPPPTVQVLQDIYIKIFGFGNAADQGKDVSLREDAFLFAEAINAQPGYLDNHAPLATIWFVGGQTPDPTDEIVFRVERLSKMDFLKMGRIIISGGSAGGKCVLKVATRVQQLGLPITFVAVWDGAFQREDLINPSQFDDDANFNRFAPKTLRLKGIPVNCQKANYYQSWGHCLDKNQEIHGFIDGFNPIDLTFDSEVEQVKSEFEGNIIKTGRDKQKALEKAHIVAFDRGHNMSEFRARNLLGPTK